MITQRELSPLALGIENVDMQAAAATEYESVLIDVRQFFIFTAIVNVTAVGPTTGDAQLKVQVFSADKTTELFEVVLATAIDTQNTASPANVTLFGAGISAAVLGSASGTIGADADVFKLAQFMKMVLEVTTQADGTSSVASVILMEGD